MLLEVRDDILTWIPTVVTSADLPFVEAHDGAFTAEELKRHAERAGTALVSCSGLKTTEREDVISTTALAGFQITVLTRPKVRASSAPAQTTKGDYGMAVADTLLYALTSARWTNAAGGVENLSAKNLYSAALDRRGTTLWVIAFDVPVELTATSAPPNLDNFVLLETQFDLAPADTVPEATDLVNVTTGAPSP